MDEEGRGALGSVLTGFLVTLVAGLGLLLAWQIFSGLMGHGGDRPFIMPFERPLAPGEDPFALEASLSPEAPAPGEAVEISAQIKSQTFPHTRAVISFFVDGERIEQLSDVIPPFQTATASYAWIAVEGTHAIRIELASAAGVKFASWEGTLEVKEP